MGETSGVKPKQIKKCCQHLMKAYDDAHFESPYGSNNADTPELGMLQDFVKGWMSQFVGRAWDILNNGIESIDAGIDGQVLFVTVLFQTLTSPERACLPHGLTSMITEPPPHPWPFIAESVEKVFKEAEEAD